MIMMDIGTYGRREEDLAFTRRPAAVELARLSGTKDISVEKFRRNMLEAIGQSPLPDCIPAY
jgi:hypothetical protein